MQRRQKNWLKYTDFTELKKITIRIYSDCSNAISCFSSHFNFVAVRFVSLRKITVNYTSVLLILLHSKFFKGKEKSGTFGGIVFFKLALKKTSVFFGEVQLNQPWRQLWTINWFSEPNFKTLLFQCAWFTWFYHASPRSFTFRFLC